MIRVAWRQQRYVFIALATATAVLIVWALIDGTHSQSLFHRYDAPPCKGGNGVPAASLNYCQALYQSWSNSLRYNTVIADSAQALAIVVGIILGVAVATEIESKTVRLAWTQSRTRARWLQLKLFEGIVAMATLSVPLCVTFAWWVRASQYGVRVAPLAFPLSGLILGAWALFAFSLVTFSGVLIRRAGWAIALSLGLFVLAAFAMQVDVRSHLVPLHVAPMSVKVLEKGSVVTEASTGGAPPNSWVVFHGLLPAHSQTPPSSWSEESAAINAYDRCVGSVAADYAKNEPACLSKLGLENVALFVPNQDFWTLQLREGGLYVFGSALLLGFSIFALRRITV